jgi:hypothetical protein
MEIYDKRHGNLQMNEKWIENLQENENLWQETPSPLRWRPCFDWGRYLYQWLACCSVVCVGGGGGGGGGGRAGGGAPCSPPTTLEPLKALAEKETWANQMVKL